MSEKRKRYRSVTEMIKSLSPNSIYYIDSGDDQIYVIAQTMEQALEKWRKSVREEESEIAEAIEPIEPYYIEVVAGHGKVIE